MTDFLTQLNPTCRVSEASNWHFGYHFRSVGPGHGNEKRLILRHVLRVHYVFRFSNITEGVQKF